MSSINQAVANIRSGMGSPKTQSPTLDQVFSEATNEFQSFVNELASTNLPWTMAETSVTVQSGQTDYIVNGVSGKVLFVIAYPEDNVYGPMSLEFCDLADVSSNFWLYSPLDFNYSRDFNEAWLVPFGAQIAFYRKENSLYFRLAPFGCSLATIKIVSSTGDWLENITTESEAVLSQYHQLPETRAMMNLLPMCEWVDDPKVNQEKRINFANSLQAKEARYARNFVYGKRALTADQVGERVSSFTGGW